MPQIKVGRVLRSATATTRSTATSAQATAGNRKRTLTAVDHSEQEDSDDNIVVARPARRVRPGDRDVGGPEEGNIVVTRPTQTVRREEQEQDIGDEIVVTRPAGPAYHSNTQRTAALQSSNRGCNGCMEEVSNEHYHCPTCDNGGFKLCLVCVFRGQQCRVEGHQIVKRVLVGGVFLDFEPGSSASIAAGNAATGDAAAGDVAAGDAAAGDVAAGDAAAGDAAVILNVDYAPTANVPNEVGHPAADPIAHENDVAAFALVDHADAIQAVTIHVPDQLEICGLCREELLPGQQLAQLYPCEHEMHQHCFDEYDAWTDMVDEPMTCLRCLKEIDSQLLPLDD